MSNKMFFSPVGGAVSLYLANLVAYYKFDSNSNDFSGKGHNGTDTAISYSNAGKVGNSATFNGTSSGVSVPHSADFNFSNGVNNLPFSLSFWLYVSNGGFKYFLGKGNTTSVLQYDISINISVTMYLYSGAAANGIGRRFTNSPVLNTWEHYVITHDGSLADSGFKLYRNGILDIGFSTSYGTPTVSPQNTDPLFIGRRSFDALYKYDGRQDEFYIWKNRVLTPTEVLDIYNKGVAGNTLI